MTTDTKAEFAAREAHVIKEGVEVKRWGKSLRRASLPIAATGWASYNIPNDFLSWFLWLFAVVTTATMWVLLLAYTLRLSTLVLRLVALDWQRPRIEREKQP